MKSCIIGAINSSLLIKLLFEIQKCCQNLCAHKPCFLMPGHNHIDVIILQT